MHDINEDTEMFQGARRREYTGRLLSFSYISRLGAGCGCRRDQDWELGVKFPAKWVNMGVRQFPSLSLGSQWWIKTRFHIWLCQRCWKLPEGQRNFHRGLELTGLGLNPGKWVKLRICFPSNKWITNISPLSEKDQGQWHSSVFLTGTVDPRDGMSMFT